MLFTTVQLQDSRALPATLDKVDMLEQRKLLTDVLEGAGLGHAIVFGAADFSRNIWPAGEPECWSAHWALYTHDRDRASFTAALTDVMLQHRLVPVPVKTNRITRTPDKAFSYGFKNVFDRKTFSGDRSARPGKAIIVPGDSEFVHLAVNLDRIGIMARFFWQECSFINGMIVPKS
jgi:hypothetical protein